MLPQLKGVEEDRSDPALFSPDGSFELEELLGGLDDPDVIARQDAGAQEEAHVPVALQLVQAAFLTQQAAQLHSWKTRWGSKLPSLRGKKNLNENGSYGICFVEFGSFPTSLSLLL